MQEIPRSYQKRVYLGVEKEALKTFLSALLGQWRYTIVEEPTASNLILAQEGTIVVPEDIPVLWFTRSRYQNSDYLSLPVTIEDLWSIIETRFHKPPRNHIRILTDHPVDAEVRGEWTSLRMVSFSDLGMRLTLHCEVAPGEEVALKFVLNGEEYTLCGKAIYAIPQGDVDGSDRCQVGLLFDGVSKQVREDIRAHILYAYLNHVKAQMPLWEFQMTLGYFSVPRPVLKRLGCL